MNIYVHRWQPEGLTEIAVARRLHAVPGSGYSGATVCCFRK